MTTKVHPPAPSTDTPVPRLSTWTTPDGWTLETGDEFRHETYGRQPFAFVAYVDSEHPVIEARELPWPLDRRKTAQELRLGNMRTLSVEGVRR